jgi:hypothetical protein
LTLSELHELNYALRTRAVDSDLGDPEALALSIGPRLQRWLEDHNVNLTDDETPSTERPIAAQKPVSRPEKQASLLEPSRYSQDER